MAGRRRDAGQSIAARVGLVGLVLVGACDGSAPGDVRVEPPRARITVIDNPSPAPPQETPDVQVDRDKPLPPTPADPRPRGLEMPSDWPAVLDGLPDINFGARERVHMDLSRRIEDRGLKAMREEQFVVAAEHFFEAIEVDPGNVDARYNLACALSRQGDRQAAVAMLDQLRDEGCGSCLGKVLKARRDTDFDPIRKSAAFIAVVADVEAELVEPAVAAAAVASWVATTKKNDTVAAVDPRRKITVRVACPTCAAWHPDVGMVRGPKALRAWIERKRRALAGGIAEPGVSECKANCCTFAEPDPSTTTPDVSFVGEVCFRLEAGVVTSLSKLSLHRLAPSGELGTGED